MIRRVGQLRDAEVVRPRLGALVDAGVEIDEMPTRRAGRLDRDLDIALAVEGAAIADIAVVVDQSVDVGGLGPADALQMDREGAAHRPAADIERQRRRRDPIWPVPFRRTGVDPPAMRTA